MPRNEGSAGPGGAGFRKKIPEIMREVSGNSNHKAWRTAAAVISAAAAAFVCSCGAGRKLSSLGAAAPSAELSLPPGTYRPAGPSQSCRPAPAVHDTIKVVNIDGKEMYLMSAIKDDNGEMVATRTLDAALVVAKFRNVAERNGRVDIAFRIIVPAMLRDKDWQLRYTPLMYVMDDSLALDKVIITGEQYRRRQLRGYQLYERFLNSIVTDSTSFIDRKALEIFLRRNIPQLYAFRNDTSYVDEAVFYSAFGVNRIQAAEHYTNHLAKRINDARINGRDRKFRRYVKSPILRDGIRLDTVLRDVGGNYVYDYVQSIAVRPKLRKVDIVLDGEIYRQDEKIYGIPRSEPLTFFISSLSALADGTERYITKVVDRRIEEKVSYNIDFGTGKWDVNPSLGDNARILGQIKSRTLGLMDNGIFDLDSVAVVSSCSPEGSLKDNDLLSRRRSKSISDYFNDYMRHVADSLNASLGAVLDLSGEGLVQRYVPIEFKSRHIPENWDYLYALVEIDSTLSLTQKEEIRAYRDIADPDVRERRMAGESWYPHLRDSVYPHLRSVQFQFSLSRKGMIKDTVHTTVPDSVYMEGVRALRERDYETAALILGPYADYNTAVACLALGRNLSALALLEKCPESARKSYMLAIIHSRLGDEQRAVQCYIDACAVDPGFIHRGNLDPEISSLIKKYNINFNQDQL